MGHIGIIAEYNPFHNGHAYQITECRKRYPDKGIIVVMSGDFVQRGTPAIYHKYLRTECALSSGVDILFELPPLFATASAEYFACAAVSALAATGIVDVLCFGAEDDCIDTFYQIADLLLAEPDNYRQLLQSHIKSGLSYPKARELAVSEFLGQPGLSSILQKPNNILGIEYIKAIKRFGFDITPVIIKRSGSGYHDNSLETPLCSAFAIREHICQNGFTPSLKDSLPAFSYNRLSSDSLAMPIFPQHFYPLLCYALWEHSADCANYLDISHDMANRITALRDYPADYDSLVHQLCSKNTTTSRVRHALLNILLGITKEQMEQAKHNNFITYLRLLGFREEASQLLKEMKQTASVPIINKVADAFKSLSPDQSADFQWDLFISGLYRHVYSSVSKEALPTEYERTVIIYRG